MAAPRCISECVPNFLYSLGLQLSGNSPFELQELKAHRAVPTNSRAIGAFRYRVVTDLWRRTLQQRSQKDGMTWWKRMTKIAAVVAISSNPSSTAGTALCRQQRKVGEHKSA